MRPLSNERSSSPSTSTMTPSKSSSMLLPRRKSPPCPNGFVWQGKTFRVTESLSEWTDFVRRGRYAKNMRPAHAVVAAGRGSLNVGRFYFSRESGYWSNLRSLLRPRHEKRGRTQRAMVFVSGVTVIRHCEGGVCPPKASSSSTQGLLRREMRPPRNDRRHSFVINLT